MVSPVMSVNSVAGNAGTLEWDLREMRSAARATDLLWDVVSRLPLFMPPTGLLLLDWQYIDDGAGKLAVYPRLDLHSAPWLLLPPVAIRATGATVHVSDLSGKHAGAPTFTLQLPARRGRRVPRVPLATGLLRMSMQAHSEHARFLPVVLRSDLGENRYGEVSLHLHSVDLAALEARNALDAVLRKRLASYIAEQVLGLMSLPGAGLAKDAPMMRGSRAT